MKFKYTELLYIHRATNSMRNQLIKLSLRGGNRKRVDSREINSRYSQNSYSTLLSRPRSRKDFTILNISPSLVLAYMASL